MNKSEFIKTPSGLLSRYQYRQRARVHLLVQGIEPRSKKSMKKDQMLAFQRAIRIQMDDQGRRPFRGPLVLKLQLVTSAKDPTHGHTIAKNLLDQLAHPLLEVGRKSLLYLDDRQIQGLTVSCRHGASEPWIGLEAYPLRYLREDLDLVDSFPSSKLDFLEEERKEEARRHFTDLMQKEPAIRERFGSLVFEQMLNAAKRDVQMSVLREGAIEPDEIKRFMCDSAFPNPSLEALLAKSPYRISIGEHPTKEGQSSSYKAEIKEKLKEFKEHFGSLFIPLLVPVALEVVVKDPPNAKVPFDLDNIVRDYLIPEFVSIFDPPSHHHWTVNLENMRQVDPALYAQYVELTKRLPKSTKVGVTRYDIWRIQRTKDDLSGGFVSAGLVPDWLDSGDVFERIGKACDNWATEIEDGI